MLKHALAGAVIALSAAAALAAPTSAVTFTSVGFQNATCCDSTRGYSFSVTQAGLAVTHLGVYDENGDGLNERHEVGLWTSTGTLIASAFVGAGTSGLLQDAFRYVDIPDLALPIGDYVVGATFATQSADRQAYNIADLVTAPGITYGQSRFINNVTPLTMPTNSLALDGLIGGTLMIDSAVTVPEPGSWALALLALGGVAASRRRSA